MKFSVLPFLKKHRWKAIFTVVLLIVFSVGCYNTVKPLPHGLNISGPARAVDDVAFIGDMTYIDPSGQRKSEQAIFDEVMAMISQSRRLILIDMFLFNDFLGASAEPIRELSQELTDALLAQKAEFPELEIIFITDPINTVYGAIPEPHLKALEEAGATVVLTNLARLRDSNPIYSAWYRIFLRPFGSGSGSALPNPFGEGQVSFRSYFHLLNFKANHRKVIVCDRGDDLQALVTSANPHDASSAHDNIALRFSGKVAWDILQAEKAVIEFSGGPDFQIPEPVSRQPTDQTLQLVTEKAILRAVLNEIEALESGDNLVMIMFYFSHRDIVNALKKAHRRGVAIAMVLDPNKDAFGREKNGIPNRQVAAELHGAGIQVRWADTHGEQCHSKMLLFSGKNRSALILGSANLTRRNLDNLNLEMNVLLEGPAHLQPFKDAQTYFDQFWTNSDGKKLTVPYQAYADPATGKKLLYRLMEGLGLSTF